MKQAELVSVSNELNELLFDAKAKEDGWIDTGGKNIKKMVKGIKEAAEILEADEELTEETVATLRKIDWDLDDYDKKAQKGIQKNLEALGVWMNGEEDEEVEEEEVEEKPKKKKPTAKKKPEPATTAINDDDVEDEEEDEEEEKPKKKKPAAAKKEKGLSRIDCAVATLGELDKGEETELGEIISDADDLFAKGGGKSNPKETGDDVKRALKVLKAMKFAKQDKQTITITKKW